MPHVRYLAAFLLCPWDGCGFSSKGIDFCLEKRGDPAFYKRVMAAWYLQADYGLVARCPGCGRYVWFGKDSKQAIPDPPPSGYDVLPDDWHSLAFIE